MIKNKSLRIKVISKTLKKKNMLKIFQIFIQTFVIPNIN